MQGRGLLRERIFWRFRVWWVKSEFALVKTLFFTGRALKPPTKDPQRIRKTRSRLLRAARFRYVSSSRSIAGGVGTQPQNLAESDSETNSNRKRHAAKLNLLNYAFSLIVLFSSFINVFLKFSMRLGIRLSYGEVVFIFLRPTTGGESHICYRSLGRLTHLRCPGTARLRREKFHLYT